MTDAEIEAYSYTAAAGKRPKKIEDGLWRWVLPDPPSHQAPENLPKPIFGRLGKHRLPWCFTSPTAALAAADEAWRRAYRDGAIGAEGGGA